MLSFALMLLTFQATLTDTLWTESCEGYSIEVHYPAIALENEVIGRILQEFASGQIRSFKDQFTEFHMEGFDTSEWMLELNIIHEPSPDGLACLTAWHWEYTGGAHGNTMTRSFIYDLDSSFGAVAATLGNIGPGIGAVGPAENYSHIPAFGKWFLSFLMLMGRLELFTVLVIFSPSFWKK